MTIYNISKIFMLCVFCVSTTAYVHAQMPEGKSLFDDSLGALRLYGSDDTKSIVKRTKVEEPGFSEALQINTFDVAKPGSYGLVASINSPLKKGDVLWLNFWARNLKTRRETGVSTIELRVDQLRDGQYIWPPHLERAISLGDDWIETSIPVMVNKDIEPKDIRLIMNFDTYPNQIELGPVTFLNCGSEINMAELPRATVAYDGSAADAEWRKEANDRIEKYRKGDLNIEVVNGKGKAVKNAEVTIRMQRNEFNWGTAINSQRILDTENPDNQKYRDTLTAYFNQIVFDNEMKWGVWIRNEPEKRGEQTKKAIAWLKSKGIPARGHVMVWPSWEHLPRFLRELKGDTAALRKAVIDHIEEQTSVMKGQFQEWDVINEPYAHNDLMHILGHDEMVKWYKTASKGDPEAKLFLNDYTMFHGEGENTASDKFFETAKYLLDNGAPIYAIGEQGHISGIPPGIPKVLQRLDRFSELGLPILITEFDINSNDDDFKARYLGDFMTAIYSHPSLTGFVQWGFWEGNHWFPVAALWNKDWTLRPHGKVYTDLVTKTWWTDADGRTSKDGAYAVRGFCGTYEVTVKKDRKTITEYVELTKSGAKVALKLK